MAGSALHHSGFEQLLRPRLTSVRPSRHLTAPVAHGRPNRSPRVIRATFLLMPVGSTSQRSVQVLGFGDHGHLTPLHRLIRFLFVRPAFCLGLPSDSQSPTTPLPLANTSPCRVCRGLSPPSHPLSHHSQTGCADAQRAMPGAPQKNPPEGGFSCSCATYAARLRGSRPSAAGSR